MATPIKASVGPKKKGCENQFGDVVTVQLLLMQYIAHYNRTHEIELPAATGPLPNKDLDLTTVKAIAWFQRNVCAMGYPDKVISPNGPTIKFLNLKLPPKVAHKNKTADEKPTPPNFFNTIWPKSHTNSKFTRTGKGAAPSLPVPAGQFEIFKFESKVREFGGMAFKISFDEKAEIKVSSADEGKLKGKRFSSGSSYNTSSREFAHKLEAKIDETLKLEVESKWSTNDLRAFEQGAIKGDFREIGKELAAAKINYSCFKRFDLEFSVSPDFPCIGAVQGKFNVPIQLLMEWNGASPKEIKSAPDAKLEVAGTLHFGPSESTWKKIAKRVGFEVLEAAAKKVGQNLARRFVTFASSANIIGLAVEFVSYEIALFQYLVKQANQRGEWTGQVMNYAQAYVLRVGGWDYLLRARDMQAPSQKGRKVQQMGVHDANLAIKKWGRKAVAEALIRKFTLSDEALKDPVEFLEMSTMGDRCKLLGNLLAIWIAANPSSIEKRVSV